MWDVYLNYHAILNDIYDVNPIYMMIYDDIYDVYPMYMMIYIRQTDEIEVPYSNSQRQIGIVQCLLVNIEHGLAITHTMWVM